MANKLIHLFGIDPGSAKKWAVYRAVCSDENNMQVHAEKCNYEIEKLDELIECICIGAAESPVLLAIDAPLKSTESFRSPALSAKGANCHFPFNVNPFTVRPCEKALSSCISVQYQNIVHKNLVNEISTLCNWKLDNSGINLAFSSWHEGVSVLGYQAAPHGPITRLFLKRLAEKVQSTNLSLSVSSAWEKREIGKIYALECHPAVAMGFWGNGLSKSKVPLYKQGIPCWLADDVIKLAERLGVYSEQSHQFQDDDELDAFVNLLTLVQFVRGEASPFGTDSLGYFLVAGSQWKRIWEEAEMEQLKKGK